MKAKGSTVRVPTECLFRISMDRSSMTSPSRIWKHFDATEQTRVCRVCGVEKSLDQFQRTMPYKLRVYHRRVCLACRRSSMLFWGNNWNLSHRDKRLRIYRKNNMKRANETRGTFECEFHKVVEEEFPGAFPIHKLHPDYYFEGKFIEIKRATVKKEYGWDRLSAHFPGLFFRFGRKSVDEQIALYPKPLMVIIFDKYSGKELTRKEFN